MQQDPVGGAAAALGDLALEHDQEALEPAQAADEKAMEEVALLVRVQDPRP